MIAKSRGAGGPGSHGARAVRRAARECSPESGCVTTPLRRLTGRSVRAQTPKHKCAKKSRVLVRVEWFVLSVLEVCVTVPLTCGCGNKQWTGNGRRGSAGVRAAFLVGAGPDRGHASVPAPPHNMAAGSAKATTCTSTSVTAIPAPVSDHPPTSLFVHPQLCVGGSRSVPFVSQR